MTPRTASTRSKALERFVKDYEAKWPKAVEKVTKDREELLAFFAFPAEHWIHLKTTNPIESTFATVRLRTKVTKGPGSRAAGLAMAYKLIESAQTRWRRGQRTAPGRAGPGRREVREGGDGRAIRGAERGGRRVVDRIPSTGLDYFSCVGADGVSRLGAAAAVEVPVAIEQIATSAGVTHREADRFPRPRAAQPWTPWRPPGGRSWSLTLRHPLRHSEERSLDTEEFGAGTRRLRKCHRPRTRSGLRLQAGPSIEASYLSRPFQLGLMILGRLCGSRNDRSNRVKSGRVVYDDHHTNRWSFS